MRLFVVGATGRTGRRVVEAGRRRGLSVVAFVRDASRLGDLRDGASVVVGDVRRAEDLARGIQPSDAVISTLGMSKSDVFGDTLARGAANVVSAMNLRGASRLLGVVGAGVLLVETAAGLVQRRSLPSYPARFEKVSAQHQGHRCRGYSSARRTSSTAKPPGE
jgi:putative NADH-flavin reductase